MLQASDLAKLKIGDRIWYHLPAWLMPIHPEKEWYGEVTYVSRPAGVLTGVLVASLMEGFTGGTDWVSGEYIVRILRAEDVPTPARLLHKEQAV